MNIYTKYQRRQILRHIVIERGIGDQHHMLDELKKQGIETTQATISRDLQEMGFVKIRMGPGDYKYELLEKTSEGAIWERLKLLFQNFVTEVRSTKNLILIKTSPGNANGVASLIDGLVHNGILGTVAGDDTILVVIDTDKNRRKVEEEFKQLL